MTKTKALSQLALLKKIRPLLETHGSLFQKKQRILAKRASGGERVETHTSDGLETVNMAQHGDYIVENQTKAREIYVLPEDKFTARYRLIGPAGNGFHEYEPTGKIVAIELNSALLSALSLPDTFRFMAPWKSDMVAKKGDFLVSPTEFSEVYRIARNEFFETYAPVSE
ncbi:MAG: hypothetical protein IT269_02525 [Saprospiraceae bacterium]|nr:hypothetical protein [Saprospiraceae bacterium]